MSRFHPILRLILGGVLLVLLFTSWLQAAPKSLAYVLQAESLATTKSGASQRLAACKRDWIVLDPAYSSDQAWTKADLSAIRRARTGRKILAYLSIGEAEDYRSYWLPGWTVNGQTTAESPDWLLSANPDWPGNYKVKYWNAEWQHILLRAVDAAMAQGFDGVYLDIVDAFEFFEQDGADFIDNRINPETGQSYRRDMVDWVKCVARQVRRQTSGGLVIPQNGSQLLLQTDFLNTINGMGMEDVFSDDNHRQNSADTIYRLRFLRKLTARKKPVLDIEYPTVNRLKVSVRKQAHQEGFAWLITDRELTTLGTSGN